MSILSKANEITNLNDAWINIRNQLIYIVVLIVIWDFMPWHNYFSFMLLVIGSFVVITLYRLVAVNPKVLTLKDFLIDLAINSVVATILYFLTLWSLAFGILGFLLLVFVYAGYRIYSMYGYFDATAKRFGLALKEAFKKEEDEDKEVKE